MKRFIAQFKPWTGGLYVVMDCPSKSERYQIGDPKPYHEANDEAEARNAGTFGIIQPITESIYAGWLGGLDLPTAP